MIFGIELTSFDEHSFAFSKIDFVAYNVIQPAMAVTVGEEEEKALNLYARSYLQELLHPAWANIDQSFHHYIYKMEGFLIRKLVKQFQDCAFPG